MYLSLAGSNSPTSLASKPIKYLFLDEVDKFPGASKKEADPISLAKERTKTFHNSKVFITSTPTLKTGHIWKALENADMVKHFFVPCPHCGKYIELFFKQIKFPNEEGMSYADRAELAFYVCQECGGVITDAHKGQMANPKMIATACIKITGLQNINGKYFVTKVTHNIGTKYTMSVEARKVQQRLPKKKG